MKKKINTLLVIIIFVFCAVLGYRFYQYFIKKDFTLYANTSCDPATEQCFVTDCSPDDDPECDTTPYKKVEIQAYDAPKCLEEHTCESFSCDGIESCSITYCEENSLEEGEVCSSDLPQGNTESNE